MVRSLEHGRVTGCLQKLRENGYRGGKFNGGNGHVTEVVRLRKNGQVTEVVSLVDGEWSCYGGGHFNGGRMVMLQKWSLYWREYGHVMDEVSFMEGEWSFYRGAHFHGHMYILLYSMVNRWCFVSCMQYILPSNLLIFLFLFINVFLHTANFFAYRGAGGLYACKN